MQSKKLQSKKESSPLQSPDEKTHSFQSQLNARFQKYKSSPSHISTLIQMRNQKMRILLANQLLPISYAEEFRKAILQKLKHLPKISSQDVNEIESQYDSQILNIENKCSLAHKTQALIEERSKILKEVKIMLVKQKITSNSTDKKQSLNLSYLGEHISKLRDVSLVIIEHLALWKIIISTTGEDDYCRLILQQMPKDIEFLRSTPLRKFMEFSSAQDPLFLHSMKKFWKLELTTNYNCRAIVKLFEVTEQYKRRLLNAQKFMKYFDPQIIISDYPFEENELESYQKEIHPITREKDVEHSFLRQEPIKQVSLPMINKKIMPNSPKSKKSINQLESQITAKKAYQLLKPILDEAKHQKYGRPSYGSFQESSVKHNSLIKGRVSLSRSRQRSQHQNQAQTKAIRNLGSNRKYRIMTESDNNSTHELKKSLRNKIDLDQKQKIYSINDKRKKLKPIFEHSYSQHHENLLEAIQAAEEVSQFNSNLYPSIKNQQGSSSKKTIKIPNYLNRPSLEHQSPLKKSIIDQLISINPPQKQVKRQHPTQKLYNQQNIQKHKSSEQPKNHDSITSQQLRKRKELEKIRQKQQELERALKRYELKEQQELYSNQMGWNRQLSLQKKIERQFLDEKNLKKHSQEKELCYEAESSNNNTQYRGNIEKLSKSHKKNQKVQNKNSERKNRLYHSPQSHLSNTEQNENQSQLLQKQTGPNQKQSNYSQEKSSLDQDPKSMRRENGKIKHVLQKSRDRQIEEKSLLSEIYQENQPIQTAQPYPEKTNEAYDNFINKDIVSKSNQKVRTNDQQKDQAHLAQKKLNRKEEAFSQIKQVSQQQTNNKKLNNKSKTEKSQQALKQLVTQVGKINKKTQEKSKQKPKQISKEKSKQEASSSKPNQKSNIPSYDAIKENQETEKGIVKKMSQITQQSPSNIKSHKNTFKLQPLEQSGTTPKIKPKQSLNKNQSLSSREVKILTKGQSFQEQGPKQPIKEQTSIQKVKISENPKYPNDKKIESTIPSVENRESDKTQQISKNSSVENGKSMNNRPINTLQTNIPQESTIPINESTTIHKPLQSPSQIQRQLHNQSPLKLQSKVSIALHNREDNLATSQSPALTEPPALSTFHTESLSITKPSNPPPFVPLPPPFHTPTNNLETIHQKESLHQQSDMSNASPQFKTVNHVVGGEIGRMSPLLIARGNMEEGKRGDDKGGQKVIKDGRESGEKGRDIDMKGSINSFSQQGNVNGTNSAINSTPAKQDHRSIEVQVKPNNPIKNTTSDAIALKSSDDATNININSNDKINAKSNQSALLTPQQQPPPNLHKDVFQPLNPSVINQKSPSVVQTNLHLTQEIHLITTSQTEISPTIATTINPNENHALKQKPADQKFSNTKNQLESVKISAAESQYTLANPFMIKSQEQIHQIAPNNNVNINVQNTSIHTNNNNSNSNVQINTSIQNNSTNKEEKQPEKLDSLPKIDQKTNTYKKGEVKNENINKEILTKSISPRNNTQTPQKHPNIFLSEQKSSIRQPFTSRNPFEPSNSNLRNSQTNSQTPSQSLRANELAFNTNALTKCAFQSKSLSSSQLVQFLKLHKIDVQVVNEITQGYFSHRHLCVNLCLLNNETISIVISHPTFISNQRAVVVVLFKVLSPKFTQLSSRLLSTAVKYLFFNDPCQNIICTKLRPEFMGEIEKNFEKNFTKEMKNVKGKIKNFLVQPMTNIEGQPIRSVFEDTAYFIMRKQLSCKNDQQYLNNIEFQLNIIGKQGTKLPQKSGKLHLSPSNQSTITNHFSTLNPPSPLIKTFKTKQQLVQYIDEYEMQDLTGEKVLSGISSSEKNDLFLYERLLNNFSSDLKFTAYDGVYYFLLEDGKSWYWENGSIGYFVVKSQVKAAPEEIRSGIGGTQDKAEKESQTMSDIIGESNRGQKKKVIEYFYIFIDYVFASDEVVNGLDLIIQNIDSKLFDEAIRTSPEFSNKIVTLPCFESKLIVDRYPTEGYLLNLRMNLGWKNYLKGVRTVEEDEILAEFIAPFYFGILMKDENGVARFVNGSFISKDEERTEE